MRGKTTETGIGNASVGSVQTRFWLNHVQNKTKVFDFRKLRLEKGKYHFLHRQTYALSAAVVGNHMSNAWK